MSSNLSSRLRDLLTVAAVLVCMPALAAPVGFGSLVPLYQGVSYQTGSVGGSLGYSVRIDLTAPGIGFTTTPRSGPLETTAQTTSQFVVSSGSQIGINANFFGPCCAAVAQPKDLLGLAVSNGNVVSPYTTGEFTSALLLTQDNRATIGDISGAQPTAYNAVTGSSILVRGGVNVAPPVTDGFSDANPRTEVGLSSDGRFLYFVVIDGRQPGYSVGATLQDAADFLIGLGAYTGLNLDGGGSSALVQSDGLGGAFALNRPSGGAERYNGNNLGLFARALQVPEPSTLLLLAGGALLLLVRRRHPMH